MALDIGGFFSGLGKAALELIKSILSAIGRFFNQLFQTEIEVVDNLERIVMAFDRTKESLEREVQKLKEFKFDPHWKTRVINVPQAVDQIKELVEMITETFKGKFERLRTPLHDLKLIFKAESLESQSIQEQPSKLVKAGAKIQDISRMIDELADAMEDVQDMAELFEKITEDVQSLDEIFLPQGKPKTTETVTYRKRTG